MKSLVERRVSVGKLPQACELSILMPLNLFAAPCLTPAQRASSEDQRKNSERI